MTENRPFAEVDFPLTEVDFPFEQYGVERGDWRAVAIVLFEQKQQQKQTPSVAKLAYSIREAIEATSLRKDSIYRLIEDGELTTVMVGSRRLIPRAALERLIKNGATIKSRMLKREHVA